MQNLIAGIKEVIRVALLAVVPVLYLSIEQGNVDWRAVGLIGTVAVLRGVEKWLHKSDSRMQLPI